MSANRMSSRKSKANTAMHDTLCLIIGDNVTRLGTVLSGLHYMLCATLEIEPKASRF